MQVEASRDMYENEPVRWLYQGKNSGWWLYEPRHNKALEEIYQTYRSDPHGYDGSRHAVTIAALPYTFDFEHGVQISARGNRRRIQRSTRDTVAQQHHRVVKGVGGMQLQVTAAAAPPPVAAGSGTH